MANLAFGGGDDATAAVQTLNAQDVSDDIQPLHREGSQGCAA